MYNVTILNSYIITIIWLKVKRRIVADVFLRQIILDTKVEPKTISKFPENIICSQAPEQSPGTEEDGVLWITDQGQRAQELLRFDCPVLAWLHEHNRDQNFSGVRYACENLEELDWDYMEKVYRRYMGIPWDILTTDRCLVRETRAEDLNALYEIYAEPSVTQYTEGLYPQRAQEEAYLKDYTENMYYFYNYGVWTICDRTTGQVIGRAGFSNREGYENPELGFVIGVPWQRQGYATEVCKALLEYGKEELGFEQVQMLVMPENEVSLRLAGNLGFHRQDQVTWGGSLYERLLLEL